MLSVVAPCNMIFFFKAILDVRRVSIYSKFAVDNMGFNKSGLTNKVNVQ
jgi:hypothetical protein